MKKLLMVSVLILVLVVSALLVLQLQKSKKIAKELQNQKPTPAPIVKIEGTNLAITLENKVVAQQENLPVLYLSGTGSLVEGQSLEDHKVVFATKLAHLLAKTDFPPATIRVITEGEIVVYDAHDKIAVFTAEKEANLQVDSLQQTLAAAKIDGDKIAKIDLRFEKPVITFK